VFFNSLSSSPYQPPDFWHLVSHFLTSRTCLVQRIHSFPASSTRVRSLCELVREAISLETHPTATTVHIVNGSVKRLAAQRVQRFEKKIISTITLRMYSERDMDAGHGQDESTSDYAESSLTSEFTSVTSNRLPPHSYDNGRYSVPCRNVSTYVSVQSANLLLM
jgi:hypothetical protein